MVAATENGDCNGDGGRDISDAVCILNWLFSGGPEPAQPCSDGPPDRENGDTNGDGDRDLSDAVFLLAWLFSGSAEPAPIQCRPTGTLRFAVLGNTGKGNTGQHEVAEAIRARCDATECDFVLLLGNNIYDDGVSSVDDSQWQEKFEVPYAPLDLDFHAVLGNHDYGGNGAGYDKAKAEYQVAYTAVSEKWLMPSRYYRFSAGNAEFFGLDTVEQLWREDDDQRTATSAWIGASTAEWKIAFGHHSYRSNGPHGNAGTYDGLPFIPIVNGAGVKEFFDEVLCGRVDLYLSAHDSSLQWLSETCDGTELVLSGAGASTSELSGSNPTLFESLALGFLLVEIEGRRLTAEFIGTDGQVLFSRSIEKP